MYFLLHVHYLGLHHLIMEMCNMCDSIYSEWQNTERPKLKLCQITNASLLRIQTNFMYILIQTGSWSRLVIAIEVLFHFRLGHFAFGIHTTVRFLIVWLPQNMQCSGQCFMLNDGNIDWERQYLSLTESWNCFLFRSK